jgi:ribosome biogenesis GTPase A
MTIQWFPGHMTSARKEAAKTMALTDVVIEVCDARLPEASSNPMIRELRLHRQRPCLKLLNKADLADPVVTRPGSISTTSQPGVKAVAISCKKPGEAARVPALCKGLAPHRKDAFKPLRMLIMGIPNVGKSTLMNALLKRRVAAVGDEPAVTKSQMSLDLGPTMTITDTPGLMWPKITTTATASCSPPATPSAATPSSIPKWGFSWPGCCCSATRLLAARYGIGPRRHGRRRGVEAIAKKRGCIVQGPPRRANSTWKRRR